MILFVCIEFPTSLLHLLAFEIVGDGEEVHREVGGSELILEFGVVGGLELKEEGFLESTCCFGTLGALWRWLKKQDFFSETIAHRQASYFLVSRQAGELDHTINNQVGTIV